VHDGPRPAVQSVELARDARRRTEPLDCDPRRAVGIDAAAGGGRGSLEQVRASSAM
jgi:hypothetical protein